MTTYGLTLSNRGPYIGLCSAADLMELARLADAPDSGWDSVWVGDSILAKPRLDSVVMLSAIAAITSRVRLGVACFASAPLREPLQLAYQWACLDQLSQGRTIFAPCQGQPTVGGGGFAEEFAVFGVDPRDRMARMEEVVAILRAAWTGRPFRHQGTHFGYPEVTLSTTPAQAHVPIWMVANPRPHMRRNVESALRRVARLGDGWQTAMCAPQTLTDFRDLIGEYAAEDGRELAADFPVCLYHNINVNEDADVAWKQSKQFLDAYYQTDWDASVVDMWTATGSVERCVEQIRPYVEAGATTITLRLTGPDQRGQYERVTSEVLPAMQNL
jgi:alkanesulfonate monooxygenase SsuD/methylene tetrahydromethanopterin reductase-like flavin-dependent oxidoreductase (luciferase family)